MPTTRVPIVHVGATPRTPITLENASGTIRRVIPPVVMTEKYAVSGGLIEGWRAVSISGCREGVLTTPSELWPGTAEAPVRSDTPGAITVVSGSTSDSAAGVGAWTVLVAYIDNDGWFRFGVAALDGTTPVAVTQWERDEIGGIGPIVGNPAATGIRVLRITTIAMGSASSSPFIDTNVGVISGSIAGVEQAAIHTGANTSECSCYHFPRGFFGHLEAVALAAETVDKVLFRILLKPFGLPLIRTSTLQASTTPLPVEITLAPAAPPRTDLIITTERTSGGSTAASSALGLVLVPDPDDPDPFPLLQPPG